MSSSSSETAVGSPRSFLQFSTLPKTLSTKRSVRSFSQTFSESWLVEHLLDRGEDVLLAGRRQKLGAVVEAGLLRGRASPVAEALELGLGLRESLLVGGLRRLQGLLERNVLILLERHVLAPRRGPAPAGGRSAWSCASPSCRTGS